MEGLYLELRQQNREHKLHLMSVAPFTVDTGMIKERGSIGFLGPKISLNFGPKTTGPLPFCKEYPAIGHV